MDKIDLTIEIDQGIEIVDLPIHNVLDQLKNNLNTNNRVILEAPPGAGKSTVVPISLLDQSWLEDKIIIMLEPRRVAARMVASQMAKSLNETVGQTVGYQIKMDIKKSSKTKILVVTEAILVRMIQSDQELSNVALIIFDEFHERSIHTDLSLALSLQSQDFLRDDLKILIMSATLNVNHIKTITGNIPVVSSQGRIYDVENIYLSKSIKQPDSKTIYSILVDTIHTALKDDGDILIFLAGMKEINTLHESLNKILKNHNLDILPLYSTLSKKEQDKAIGTSKNRKIILSTNIAQTSLTIVGVKIVIDTGLEKQSIYNHKTNMDHLELTFISEDSSIQRAGRAGRLSNGKCYKLWHKDKILQQSTKAEILRVDLSSALLDLALWGCDNFEDLNWLDIPAKETLNHTYSTLENINTIDHEKNITQMGRDSIKLGLHPRLSYMILQSNKLGYGYESCIIAAILTSNIYTKDSDIQSIFIDCYEYGKLKKEVDNFYKRLIGISPNITKSKNFDLELIAVLLLFAYPNRLAKQRGNNENIYKLSNGKGAILNYDDSLFNSEYIVVVNLNGNIKNSYISLASKISYNQIEKYFSNTITTKQTIKYNKNEKKFDIRENRYFLKLQLSSKPITNTNNIDYKSLILELIKKEGLGILTWDKKSLALQNRVNFFNKQNYDKLELPNMENEFLLETLDLWFDMHCTNIKTIKQLEEINLYPILSSMISWDNLKTLDTLLPIGYKVPSGSVIHIDYSYEIPTLNVKVQEIFGLNKTPLIFNNMISLNINLLSPAMKSIALTNDLQSFWDNSYIDVRKDLRGKYKRHYWPENPYEAIATSKTKKHMMANI
ncbi:MAG: ATP-dependent helicase HrpB [Campylobacteraceae bacterium]|nr:ATP-dependent helicase HrpB [Campylobacteraceae bacterium]